MNGGIFTTREEKQHRLGAERQQKGKLGSVLGTLQLLWDEEP